VTGEIYLVDLVTLAHDDERQVAAYVGNNSQDLSGINDRLQMAEAERELNRQIIERHLLAGVTIHDPWASVFIDSTVEIEPDVTIEPNVVLRGNTRVGRDTVIKTGSQIIDSTVGERCVIWASVIETSQVGNDVRIGPFAHLRAGCAVGDGALHLFGCRRRRAGVGRLQPHLNHPKPQNLSRLKGALCDFLPVDERAVRRAGVLDENLTALQVNLGVMARHGSLRNLEHVVRDPSDRRLFGFQLESAACETFAQENQSRHRL
jgi:carbonic anhydrase/acetyltransferase-like protein (isoleucine patch superfamily)